MLGIGYLLLSIWLGKELLGRVPLPCRTGEKGIEENGLWFWVPSCFGIGVLVTTWEVYLISWIFHVYAGIRQPLFYGNLVMAIGTLGLIFFLRRGEKPEPVSLVADRKRMKRETILFLIVGVFITASMFYVFYRKGGYLYSGFTVYGDYAPHTAVMRSFSWGDNFPTQYPHFGGEDIKYHFMFQFLAGNLEYLGLPIDWAFNLVSILSLLGFLMLLYTLVWRIFHSVLAGALTIGMFFFRSSFSFFRFLWEHGKAGDLWETLKTNTSFIGYTPNENWGLWNYNVYLNQRHLAFGLLLVTFAVLVFWDWFQAGMDREEQGIVWLKGRIFSREAWITRCLPAGIFTGLVLGLSAFWNGAALIGGLLILCGMAAFSNGKLDYLAAAVTAVLLSVCQSRMFIRGEAVSPKFQWGFLVENPTLGNVIKFLFWMSGLVFLGTVILVWFQKRTERCLLFSFLLPLVFAFCVSLTPDITVNHKYIIISMQFMNLLWAGMIARLFHTGWAARAGAIFLTAVMTVTGIYDFCVILKGNDSYHRVAVNLNSDLTGWLKENTDSEDLLLTPEYAMNEVTISGAMMYCGWPYYAWSAGYDTYYRAGKAVEMYTTSSVENLKKVVEEEGITWIVFEDDSQIEGRVCREDVIAAAYPLAYTSENGRIRIYETR